MRYRFTSRILYVCILERRARFVYKEYWEESSSAPPTRGAAFSMGMDIAQNHRHAKACYALACRRAFKLIRNFSLSSNDWLGWAHLNRSKRAQFYMFHLLSIQVARHRNALRMHSRLSTNLDSLKRFNLICTWSLLALAYFIFNSLSFVE